MKPETNMFSRTKYDYKNVPSLRSQDLSQQRLRTERARLREAVKGLAEMHYVKAKEKGTKGSAKIEE